MKIRPVFNADGQAGRQTDRRDRRTDRHQEANSRLSHFTKAPDNDDDDDDKNNNNNNFKIVRCASQIGFD